METKTGGNYGILTEKTKLKNIIKPFNIILVPSTIYIHRNMVQEYPLMLYKLCGMLSAGTSPQKQSPKQAIETKPTLSVRRTSGRPMSVFFVS